jgi:hypothetical protein
VCPLRPAPNAPDKVLTDDVSVLGSGRGCQADQSFGPLPDAALEPAVEHRGDGRKQPHARRGGVKTAGDAVQSGIGGEAHDQAAPWAGVLTNGVRAAAFMRGRNGPMSTRFVTTKPGHTLFAVTPVPSRRHASSLVNS